MAFGQVKGEWECNTSTLPELRIQVGSWNMANRFGGSQNLNYRFGLSWFFRGSFSPVASHEVMKTHCIHTESKAHTHTQTHTHTHTQAMWSDTFLIKWPKLITSILQGMRFRSDNFKRLMYKYQLPRAQPVPPVSQNVAKAKTNVVCWPRLTMLLVWACILANHADPFSLPVSDTILFIILGISTLASL